MKKVLTIVFGLLFFAVSVQAFEVGDVITEQQLLAINAQTIGLECQHDFTRVILKTMLIEHQTSCLDLNPQKDSQENITGYKIFRRPDFYQLDVPNGQAILNCFYNNSPLVCVNQIINYLANNPQLIQQLHDLAVNRHQVFAAEIRQHIFELQMNVVGDDIPIELNITQQELNP